MTRRAAPFVLRITTAMSATPDEGCEIIPDHAAIAQ
ncbi:hypothetical protein U879_19905 [Defluviimonas sp. 20V17]|nr:hypothetical protein U879_19905 [Defluviimonas sp. 20V17]